MIHEKNRDGQEDLGEHSVISRSDCWRHNDTDVVAIYIAISRVRAIGVEDG